MIELLQKVIDIILNLFKKNDEKIELVKDSVEKEILVRENAQLRKTYDAIEIVEKEQKERKNDDTDENSLTQDW